MEKILQYSDYIDFLSDWISSRPKKGHGVKSKMSNCIGSVPAQITQVLKKEVHLTPDQAAKMITFLELSNLEGEFFFRPCGNGPCGK